MDENTDTIKERLLQEYERLKQLLGFYLGRGSFTITIAEAQIRIAEIIKEISELGFGFGY